MSTSSRNPLKVVLVLKTSTGGDWTLPQVDALRARGHEVVAILPGEDGFLRKALTERGVVIADSGFSFRFGLKWSSIIGLVRLRRLILKLNPDVLFYHLYASALATRIASLGLGVPRIHMVPGPLFLESRAIRMVERLLTRLDTLTIGGSEFTMDLYQRLGLPCRQVIAIPYGVDTEIFKPPGPAVRQQVRRELKLQDSAFVVTMIAYVYAPKRLVYRGRGVKGHEVLLEAWARFSRIAPEARLVIVGGGFDEEGEQYRQRLIQRFDITNVNSHVTWIDSTDDVPRYYAAADLSVSPSLSENHGAAQEAGAMGVPSIVSDAGALPETVTSDCGWVIAKDDVEALVCALNEAYRKHIAGQLQKMGEMAREFTAARFDSKTAGEVVADAVEATVAPSVHQRSISLFTEDRYGLDSSGCWAAIEDRHEWARYKNYGAKLRMVVRADARLGSATVRVDDDVDVDPLPYYVGPGAMLRQLPRLILAIARAVHTSEIIILRVPGTISSIAALLCWVMRRKYAVEVVGDPADVLRAGVLGSSGSWLAPLAAHQMKRVVRTASSSRFVTTRALQDRYPPSKGTPSIAVTNLHLDQSVTRDLPRDWPPPPFRAISVGSQEQHYKGHDVLLRAVRQLADEGLPIEATIVGGGRVHDEIVALANRLGLNDRVNFTGRISDRTRIVELLDGASLFVMPSRTEGLPRALLEAMARALPCVGSRVGGIPELLDEPYLVPVGDHLALARRMKALLTCPDVWRRQSERNLEVARSFQEELVNQSFTEWLASVPPARTSRRWSAEASSSMASSV